MRLVKILSIVCVGSLFTFASDNALSDCAERPYTPTTRNFVNTPDPCESEELALKDDCRAPDVAEGVGDRGELDQQSVAVSGHGEEQSLQSDDLQPSVGV
jgi:hypothetical protein